MQRAGGLAYMETGPADGFPVLLVHGYPESSYMWRELSTQLGDAGFRALAPDHAGFGDSPVDRPGTWQRHVEALERFRSELEIESCVLVVHDWGGLIGLRWACDHPGIARSLVISDTGFWADGKWHGLAEAMRSEQGEEILAGMTREGFGALLGQVGKGFTEESLDEYWKAFSDEDRRAAQLELYRSGEFPELADYEGRLAVLGVPSLVVWGENDDFSPLAGAHRFAEELPGAELKILEGAGHFVWEDAPVEANRAAVDFLLRVAG